MIGKKKRSLIDSCVTYFILGLFSAVFILPFLWMVFTSLKTYEQNLAFVPTWLPKPFYFKNYSEALFGPVVPYVRAFFNSVLIVIIGVSATLVTSTMISYGFARFKPRESKFLFILLLSTMMLPSQVTLISSYVIWAKLKMINTYIPLLISAFFGGSAFYIFLMRQFIKSVPYEFEEAARVDGANRFAIFVRIVVPLLLPAIAAIAIFSFQGYWNDYMGPLIYINSEKKYTVAQALTKFQMQQETLWGEMMAAGIITIIPIIIVFAAAQKYFISGITIGGVKG